MKSNTNKSVSIEAELKYPWEDGVPNSVVSAKRDAFIVGAFWAGLETSDTLSAQEFLPLVTRIEVIDADGRAFVQHYVDAGASMSVQDQGRTLKLFAGRSGDSLRYPVSEIRNPSPVVSETGL